MKMHMLVMASNTVDLESQSCLHSPPRRSLLPFRYILAQRLCFAVLVVVATCPFFHGIHATVSVERVRIRQAIKVFTKSIKIPVSTLKLGLLLHLL